MSSQVVFLSLFLGLMSGPHLVELQVAPGVHTVRILLENRPVAVLQQPPWRATIDFGSAIVPSELAAVGYDDRGNEVSRATQLINVPRPVAEFDITLTNDDMGVPVTAQFKWEHLVAAKVTSASLTVDSKAVPLDKMAIARLPRLDMKHPHVIAGELKFEDGFITRREIVAGGELTATEDIEMTPVAVRQTVAVPSATLGDCFTSGGAPIRIGAVENAPALVILVIDPDPKVAPDVSSLKRIETRHRYALDLGSSMRAIFPLAEQRQSTNNSTAMLFPPSSDVHADEAGLLWFVTRPYKKFVDDAAPRQFADAVGVAGLNTITGAHRRAVVLVLSPRDDASAHSPQSVRSYLASIGVPLFVWSTGPRRDAWGTIDDISTPSKMQAAVDRLRAELKSQRVAWVAADPVTALRVHATGKCGITPLASQ
ncbi:MAG TPA: hypothetical protein VGQ21_18160 [Thermoanaerobaculia bacterium]|nr:hypothetical protein [Thermoanaerobaculia bacterium]